MAFVSNEYKRRKKKKKCAAQVWLQKWEQGGNEFQILSKSFDSFFYTAKGVVKTNIKSYSYKRVNSCRESIQYV
jgi:hypothetical protein